MNIVSKYLNKPKGERFICTAPFRGLHNYEVKLGEILYLRGSQLFSEDRTHVLGLGSDNQIDYTRKLEE